MLVKVCFWPGKELCASNRFLGSCQAERIVRSEHTADFSDKNRVWLPWWALLNQRSWAQELAAARPCASPAVCRLNLSDSTSGYTHGPPLQGADITLPELTAYFGLPASQSRGWVSLQSQLFLVSWWGSEAIFSLVTLLSCIWKWWSY